MLELPNPGSFGGLQSIQVTLYLSAKSSLIFLTDFSVIDSRSYHACHRRAGVTGQVEVEEPAGLLADRHGVLGGHVCRCVEVIGHGAGHVGRHRAGLEQNLIKTKIKYNVYQELSTLAESWKSCPEPVFTETNKWDFEFFLAG